MKTNTLLMLTLFALLLPINAIAEEAFVKGTVFIMNPGGKSPIPASSYEVTLYDIQKKMLLNPSVTDTFGRFAFYGVRSEKYLLDIIRRGKNWTHLFWRQEVKAPLTLEPIVLAQSASVIPRAKFSEVVGQKDRYDFALWLDVPNEQRNRIKKVTYILDHPTFKNKEYPASASDNFKISYRGWGCLSNVIINIQGQGGDSSIYFDMCSALADF